jgi:hypothetical protein
MRTIWIVLAFVVIGSTVSGCSRSATDAKAGDCLNTGSGTVKIVDCAASTAQLRLTRETNSLGTTCAGSEQVIRIAPADLNGPPSKFWCAESVTH